MIIGICGTNARANKRLARLIQFLNCDFPRMNFSKFVETTPEESFKLSGWQIRGFKGNFSPFLSRSLKLQMTGVDDDSMVLPEPWRFYRMYKTGASEKLFITTLFDLESANAFIKAMGDEYSFEEVECTIGALSKVIESQFQKVLPSFWVNCLIARYKPMHPKYSKFIEHKGETISKSEFNPFLQKHYEMALGVELQRHEFILPKWIITDVKTQREVNMIRERGGIILGANRDLIKNLKSPECKVEVDHEFHSTMEYEDTVKQICKITDKYSRKIIQNGTTS